MSILRIRNQSKSFNLFWW